MTGDHVADFKLSITKALADQLAERLEPLKPRALTAEAVGELQRRSGIYLLFHEGHRVYVGKAQQPLPTRLRNHWDKLRGRDGVAIGNVAFVCLYVDEDLDAAAPERLLIRRYRSAGGPDGVPWNVNGFGNKDPGRQRDASTVKANHFDALYPASMDWTLELEPGHRTLADVLHETKDQLPYNFRFDRSSGAEKAYRVEVDVPDHHLTLAQVMDLAVGALPVGWQATALPGYAILYSRQEELPSARAWWRRDAAGVHMTEHSPALADAEEITEEDDQRSADDSGAA